MKIDLALILTSLAALTGPQDFPATMLKAFLPRRDFFVADLRRIPGVSCVKPMGALYAFVGGYSPQANALYRSVMGDDHILDEPWIKEWRDN